MAAQSLFPFVNFRMIFCVALVTCLSDMVLTRDLFTARLDELDDVRNALMSFSLGSTSPPVVNATSSPTNWDLSASPTPKPTTKPPVTEMKRTSPSNKFLEALHQIERAVYEAQAVSGRFNTAILKEDIILATQKRNYQFARKSLGYALFGAMELDKRRWGYRKRGAISVITQFVTSLKTELGAAAFDTFMSVNGEVTLTFAIDDTGSMSDEIQAAKDIAISIVNHTRNASETVDYILSPFNDPGTGPVVYKRHTEGAQFISAINALSAHGGGDCPELTIKGILDAIAAGPRTGSPLYVFTDATAKDATKDSIEEVLLIAKELGLTINFFTTGLCSNASYKPFEDIASETCGQMLKLPNAAELKKMSGATAVMLGGTTCLAGGASHNTSNGREKGSVTSQYSIPIDDSTEKILVSVTTQNANPSITLQNPSGFLVSSGRISFPYGAMFEVSHPRPGTWKLIVSRAGKHTYSIKGSSKTNVDFEFFFVMIPGSGRPTPISQPLLGKTAIVILTVAGANMINSRSLTVDLIGTDGTHLGTTTTKAHGSSGAHFSASFTPPSVPFKLKLKGTTKKGNAFERSSRSVVHPSHALIGILISFNMYTVRAGDRGYAWFYAYNTGPTEIYDIKVKDHLNYALNLDSTNITVWKDQFSFFIVYVSAPASAVRGTTDAVLATITGRTSRTTVSHVVNLMVV